MPSLPSQGSAEQTPIPTSVYRYFDKYNVLLYVGITSRGMQRNREHNQGKEWWGFVHRQEVEHYPTRDQARARETDLIKRHRPPFNKAQNPDHAGMRATYFLFAALPEPQQATIGGHPATKRARQLVQQLSHRLPLTLQERHDDRAVYAHRTAHLALAQSINIAGNLHLVDGRRLGKLIKVEQRANRIFYTFTRTEGNKTPQAINLWVSVTQNPLTLWARKVVAA